MLGYYGDKDAPTFPPSLNLLINGRASGTMSVVKNTGIAELNATQTEALLLALSKAANVQFISGKNLRKLSGEGAAAVLLKMDEVQGRLGTATALIKKGNASDDGVLAALLLPMVQMGPINSSKPIDKALAAAVRPLLPRGKEDICYELKEREADLSASEQLQLWRINTTKVLVSARCWSGAYNFGHGFWLINDKQPYQPQLITESGKGYSDGYSNGIIGASHKDRGLGDCWSSDEWVWNGIGFTHSSASTTGMCKLVAPGGAWNLPTIVSNVIPAAK